MDNTQSQKTVYLIAIIALIGGIIIGYSFMSWGNRDGRESTLEDRDIATQDNDMSTDHMLYPAIPMDLSGKTGDTFDKAFLDAMILHHEGAVVMAKQVLKVSKRPELIKLANEIIVAQNKEITQMKAWRDAWFSTQSTSHGSMGTGGTSASPAPTQPRPSTGGGMVACTMEARMCPDGSYVGRQGPNCEFAACPGN